MTAKRSSGPGRRLSRRLISAGDARRREQRFKDLLAASVAIFSERTLDRVLQRVVDLAREVVGARYAALGVLAPDGVSLSRFATSGLSAAERARIGDLPHGRGLLGLVIREGKPVRTADITRHPSRHGFPPHHPPMRSFLGVPLASGKRVFGNLYLADKIGAEEFDGEDEAIAVLFANQAAAAVENARLFEEGERLVAQVRDMQRERDLFFAMMNHELRNALAGVYGWAERLVHRRRPELEAQAAQEVYEGTERTISLLNNLLDLTQLDAGRVQPVWREVEPEVAVRRALIGFEPAAEAKQLTLEADVPASLPSLVTDPVRLQQILVNLLSNAVRHSPVGGRICVCVRANGGSLDIAVRDEGPGIPTEVQERIFEPFERFDSQSGHGTGLGLAVSRRLAEMLGGKLTLASAPGVGSSFTLALPRRARGVQ
jgi:signal transduction histidine kinase